MARAGITYQDVANAGLAGAFEQKLTVSPSQSHPKP